MKNVLYSNYYDSDRFDEAKQYLAEDLECELDEVSDDQVWDQLNWEDQLNWDDCEDILKEIDQRAPAFVFVAEVHTRYPEFYGYSNLSGCYKYTEHLLRSLCDLGDYIEIWTEDGRLFCKYDHHDGGGSFEIKALTEKGNEAYDRWNYSRAFNDKSEAEMLGLLANLNFYSRRLKVAA